jgi:ABC-2 type transport system ATP-binding protein
MLLGLLEKSSGTVEILGLDPEKSPELVKSKIGYVSENQKMYDWMTVAETLWFSRSFYSNWDEKLADELLSRFSLPRNPTLRELSRGMYAQVALIIAMCHNSELLILDDPTSGLDSIVRREFMESIAGALAVEERTVFFSTHIVNEVEKLSDHVGIMHEGNLLVSMPVEELKDKVKKIRMVFDDNIPDGLSVSGLLKKERFGHELSLTVKDFRKEMLDDISNRYKPKTCEVQTLMIEDIFVAMVG